MMIKKILFKKDFEFYGAFTDGVKTGYYEVDLIFDFKDGLRFSCQFPDFSCRERNIFKAILRCLEHAIVGYGKYQDLKEKVREKGLHKQL